MSSAHLYKYRCAECGELIWAVYRREGEDLPAGHLSHRRADGTICGFIVLEGPVTR